MGVHFSHCKPKGLLAEEWRRGWGLNPPAPRGAHSLAGCLTCRPVDLSVMAPGQGFEPRYAAPKAAVLPLNEPGSKDWCGRLDLNQHGLVGHKGLDLARLHFTTPAHLVAPVGVEPTRAHRPTGLQPAHDPYVFTSPSNWCARGESNAQTPGPRPGGYASSPTRAKVSRLRRPESGLGWHGQQSTRAS